MFFVCILVLAANTFVTFVVSNRNDIKMTINSNDLYANNKLCIKWSALELGAKAISPTKIENFTVSIFAQKRMFALSHSNIVVVMVLLTDQNYRRQILLFCLLFVVWFESYFTELFLGIYIKNCVIVLSY